MKRDPYISKLIRESGTEQAPEGFTAGVMDKIEAIPVKKPYKPLIGLGGRFVIILFIVAVVILSLIYSDQGGELFGLAKRLSSIEHQLPHLNINLEFLKQLKISTGVVSGLLAMFFLVLSDAWLNHRRRLS